MKKLLFLKIILLINNLIQFIVNYTGIRIQGAGTNTDPIDLTFDPSIFRPPPHEEWVKLYGDQQETIQINSAVPSRAAISPDNPFDTTLMSA